MPPERAYLLVGQTAPDRTRGRGRPRPADPGHPTGAARINRRPAAGRAHPAPAAGRAHLPGSPTGRAHPPAPAAGRANAPTPTVALRRSRRAAAAPGIGSRPPVGPVRRHRAGRHRLGAPGLRHWPASGAGPEPRSRPARSVAHRARHAAGAPAAVAGPELVRYASLLIVLSTVLVSGWFAASGASAFAQMIRP